MPSMDYDRVEWLAGQVAAGADALSNAGPGIGGAIAIGLLASAFGNTAGADDCRTAAQDALGDATTASGHLLDHLGSDADRFSQVIRCFQENDHAAADQICAADAGRMNVYSAHVHSGGSLNDDYIRATQIDNLAANADGPSVIGADLNTEVGDGLSGDAVAGFEDRGYDIDAGEVGGTSSGGHSIDYVMTSTGLSSSGAPELVDGGPSDHDGQRVGIVVPRW